MEKKILVRRLTAIVCLLAMLLSILPMGAFAGEEEVLQGNCGADGDGSNLTWSLDADTGTLTISGTGAMKNYTVEDRAPWDDFGYISEVVISEGVTSVGDFAFPHFFCAGFKLPQSLERIGKQSFYNCGFSGDDGLFTIPKGVTEIGERAFTCSYIDEISVEEGNTAYFVSDNCLIERATNTIIYACRGAVSIPTDIEGLKIGKEAFATFLGNSITVPANVVSVGMGAFDSEYLFDIYFLSDDTEIADGAVNTHRTAIHGNLDSNAEKYAKKYYGAVFAGLDEKVERGGKCGADGDGSNLTWTLDIETGVLEIKGSGAMADYLDESYGYSSTYAPWNIYSSVISEIKLPDGLTKIGTGAFIGVHNYTMIVEIPESVTEIGKKAFCDFGADAIIINSADTVIYDSEDTISEGTEIRGLAGSTAEAYANKYGRRFTLSKMTSDSGTCGAEGDGSNLTWSFDADTCILTISGTGAMADYLEEGEYGFTNTTAPWKNYSTAITEVKMSEGLTKIGAGAFMHMQNTSIWVIPESVAEIGEEAFGNSSIAEITIKSADTVIFDSPYTLSTAGTIKGHSGSTAEKYAEKYGRDFSDIDNPDGNGGKCGENLTWSFDADTGTLTISGTGAMKEFDQMANRPWHKFMSNVQKIVISDGVTSISDYAFYQLWNTQTVILPDSLQKIGICAFFGCDSLINIKLPKNLSEIGIGAFYGSHLGSDALSVDSGNTHFYMSNGCLIEKAEKRIIYACYNARIPTDIEGLVIGMGAFGDYAGSKLVVPSNVIKVEEGGLGSEYTCDIYFESSDVEIYDSEYTINSIAVIHGAKGSTAEEYANKYDRLFGSFDESFRRRGYCGAEGDGTGVQWMIDTDTGTLIITGNGKMKEYSYNYEEPWALYSNIIRRIYISEGIESVHGLAYFNDCDIYIENPNALIPVERYTDGFGYVSRVHGYKGSTAETYVKEQNDLHDFPTYEFILLIAHEHDYGNEWKSDSAKHWHECEICHSITDEADHSWDNGVITVNATESQEGQKKYTCEVCGAEKFETIGKLDHDHNYGDWKKDESKHWHECSKCHEKKDEADHSWDNGVTVVEATEDAGGQKKFTCDVCGATKLVDNEKLPHTHDYGEEWKSNDTKHWHECSKCHEKKDEADHNWDNGKVTKEPTEEADGEKLFTCSDCKATKTEKIEKLPTPPKTGLPIGIVITAILAAVLVVAFSIRKRKQYKTEG